MYGYIYKITCKINNKIYIGQTTKSIEERFKAHIESSRKESLKSRHLYGAMNKYGVENFYVELVETCDTKEQLDEREKFWIRELNSRDPNVGYNIHEGGTGGRTQVEYKCTQKQLECLSIGWHMPMSEENKQLVSKIHKGKIVTQETRQKLSIAQRGRKATEETREKLSKSHKGLKMPERDQESREKYRKASQGRVHIHNGDINKNVKLEELESYLLDGWERGYHYKK